VKPAVLLGAGLLAAAVGWGWFGGSPQGGPSPAAAPNTAMPAPTAPVRAAAAGLASRPASSPAAPVLGRGSLAGTELDGDWAWPGQGALRPGVGLRRRFDHLLSRQGELPLAALQDELARLARTELPPPVADEVLALWGRYLALQQHPWRTHVHPRRPETWRPALAERQQVRRHHLGPAWAAAFYAIEERELSATIVALESGQPAPAAPEPTPPLHPQAAEREAAVQAEWQAWERRLTEARTELARLRTAPELTELQRQAAAERLIAERFPGTEAVRARALLGLPTS
jgi:lipase chaperone LimK